MDQIPFTTSSKFPKSYFDQKYWPKSFITKKKVLNKAQFSIPFKGLPLGVLPFLSQASGYQSVFSVFFVNIVSKYPAN